MHPLILRPMSFLQLSMRAADSWHQHLTAAHEAHRDAQARHAAQVMILGHSVLRHFPENLVLRMPRVVEPEQNAAEARFLVQKITSRVNRKLAVQRWMVARYLKGHGRFAVCSFELVERIVGFAYPRIE